MITNQAFTILQKHGDSRSARIITNKYPDISTFRTFVYAWKLHHHVPVSKIIHSKWFYGLDFYTNKYTLDPRPDTETLVEAVIKDYAHTNTKLKILDVGTGTGCIICSLCKEINNIEGIALDKSYKALKVASINIKKFGLQNQITIKHGTFEKYQARKQFDIVVANPPYIKCFDKRVNIEAKHDPKIALYAKHGGLYAYEQLAKNAKFWLKDNGKIYLEIGIGQARSIIDIFKYNGWIFDRVEKDLNNVNRVLIFKF